MTATSSRFTGQRAPCGRTVAGEHNEYRDGQGLITDEYTYACGCRSRREEYHDGSVERLVVRHDGKVLVDEELRGE
jgi:hypothetical protein